MDACKNFLWKLTTMEAYKNRLYGSIQKMFLLKHTKNVSLKDYNKLFMEV